MKLIDKDKIIRRVKNVQTTDERNRMGCSENWYNPYYALSKTFSIEELEAMSEKELNNLVILADNIADGLY